MGPILVQDFPVISAYWAYLAKKLFQRSISNRKDLILQFVIVMSSTQLQEEQSPTMNAIPMHCFSEVK